MDTPKLNIQHQFKTPRIEPQRNFSIAWFSCSVLFIETTALNSISEDIKNETNDIAEYEYRMLSTALSFDVLLKKPSVVRVPKVGAWPQVPR